MALLSQFLLRLAFGLAFGMGITSPRLVSSGYFRNHLYVTLGLATLATLAVAQFSALAAWFAAAAAFLSFLGAACWLIEAKRAGAVMLWFVAATALAAALISQAAGQGTPMTPLGYVSVITSGLLLGTTMAAMLLGHWYLNSPGMELAPLRRLLIAMAIAVALQAIVSGIAFAGDVHTSVSAASAWWMFVLLRWLFGICGVAALIWMAWETLKIPNTQSATGILYVAVIGVFVGELAAQLLSAQSPLPV